MKRAFILAILSLTLMILLTGCSGTPQNEQSSNLVCSITTQISNNQICYQSNLANNSTLGFTITNIEVTVCVLGICGPSQTIPEAEAYCPAGQSETNSGCVDLTVTPGILTGTLKIAFSGTYDDGTPDEKTCTVNW